MVTGCADCGIWKTLLNIEFVKHPDRFNLDEPNTPQRWARWETQFGTYFITADLDKKWKQVQVARLLNAAGPEAQEIHELFTSGTDEDQSHNKTILAKFSGYCRPKKNVMYERHKFLSRS